MRVGYISILFEHEFILRFRKFSTVLGQRVDEHIKCRRFSTAWWPTQYNTLVRVWNGVYLKTLLDPVLVGKKAVLVDGLLRYDLFQVEYVGELAKHGDFGVFFKAQNFLHDFLEGFRVLLMIMISSLVFKYLVLCTQDVFFYTLKSNRGVMMSIIAWPIMAWSFLEKLTKAARAFRANSLTGDVWVVNTYFGEIKWWKNIAVKIFRWENRKKKRIKCTPFS